MMIPRYPDQRGQVMTRWPASVPTWGSFPATAEGGTEWVNAGDHEQTTAQAAGPLRVGATASAYGSFVSDIAIGGNGGTTNYSGTATGALIDADGVSVQTISAAGSGGRTIGDQRTQPDGSTLNYIDLQTASMETATVSGTARLTANGQTKTIVDTSDPFITQVGGAVQFIQFIASISSGQQFEEISSESSTCRVIPLTLSP